MNVAAVNRFQRLIQQRLDERNWSLNKVATKAGVNRQTLYRLMAMDAKRMPADKTIAGLARALDYPERMLRDAAAESIGIRVYDEPVDDPDTQVVIATMEKLTPARRRQIREMAEIIAREELGYR